LFKPFIILLLVMNTWNPELLLPPWLREYEKSLVQPLHSEPQKMMLVIELARENMHHKTGGPFGAAIFDCASGKAVAFGVNMVVQSNCSHAHAEMVAIAIAEHRTGTYNLSLPGRHEHELVTSCEPCAMCFGAIIWSGITRLVCGAYTTDACTAGFDEGPKPETWIEELEKRGIEVVTGVCHPEAQALFQQYKAEDGIIYNGLS
jgi:tRNA(Arg) A34 adenosine deaminase TadA